MSRKKKTRPAREISLVSALSLWFDRRLTDLPADLQKRVELHFPHVFPWDSLWPNQRRSLAVQIDAKYPRDLAAKEELKLAFRKGYKNVSVPLRNKRNAKRPRPSRQKVRDTDILSVKLDLEAEGVKHHNQCSEAYRLLFASKVPLVSMWGFRKRWNRLGLNKKAT